jgi:hypothetical protein
VRAHASGARGPVKYLTLEPYQVNDEFGPPVIDHLTRLQQLQAFSTTTAHALPEYVLRHLAEVSTLRDVSISYERADAASRNQYDWVLMQHLKQLSIDLKPTETRHTTGTLMSLPQLHQLLGSISYASTLTRLQVRSSTASQPVCTPSLWLSYGVHIQRMHAVVQPNPALDSQHAWKHSY